MVIVLGLRERVAAVKSEARAGFSARESGLLVQPYRCRSSLCRSLPETDGSAVWRRHSTRGKGNDERRRRGD